MLKNHCFNKLVKHGWTSKVRPLSSCRVLRNEIPSLLEKLRSSSDESSSSSSPPTSKYLNFITHPEFTNQKSIDSYLPELIKLTKHDTSLKPSHHIEVHNTILENLLKIDSSLSTIHQLEILKLEGNLTIDALIEVIKNNSGRVHSSLEILNKNYDVLSNLAETNRSKLEELVQVVIDKLIYGEEVDKLEEEGYTPSETSLIKAGFFSKFLTSSQIKESLIKKALQLQNYSLIRYIGISKLEDLKNFNDNELNKVYEIWNPETLSNEEIFNNIDVLSRLIITLSDYKSAGIEYNQETTQLLEKLESDYPIFTTKTKQEMSSKDSTPTDLFTKLTTSLSSQLMNPSTKFTPLRISLLKAKGIYQNQIQETLKLYDEFSILDKSNVDILMTTMVIILSYQAVITKNQSFLTIAETLVPQPIPIKTLQSLILAKSQFNLDDALQLYNDYIQKVSKLPDPNNNNISQSTLITESLIWGYISKRDREFAYLINDGAITNGLVQGDANMAKLKAIFKKYGDIFGEETNDFDALLHEEILNALKRV